MNNFNQIIIVKFEGIWRTVLGCVINPHADNVYIQYVLNGRVYECKDIDCWRLIGPLGSRSDLDQSALDQCAIDYNNGDLEYITQKKRASAKLATRNARTVEAEILNDMNEYARTNGH